MAELLHIDDLAALVRTRIAWHTLAEHVLAAARYRATGRIGLAATVGGFGTPVFDNTQLLVTGHTLVVVHAGAISQVVNVSTIAAVATAIGITPGGPVDVYPPSTALEPDAPLDIDPAAAELLGTWFSFGEAALHALRGDEPTTSSPVLWPEHFDLAVELGDEATGSRATFGVSPGDATHELPYLYVTHWSQATDDPRWTSPYWNNPTFGGASRSLVELQTAADPIAAAAAFFREGVAAIRSPGIG